MVRDGGRTDKDYKPLHEVVIPKEQAPEDYNKEQRSKIIHERVKELGHPDMIDRNSLAERFDVTRQCIHYDLHEVVFPYMEENVGKNHKETSSAIFHKALKELLEEEKYDKAAKNVQRWNEWLSDRGIADKAPDEVQVSLADEQDEEILDEMF